MKILRFVAPICLLVLFTQCNVFKPVGKPGKNLPKTSSNTPPPAVGQLNERIEKIHLMDLDGRPIPLRAYYGRPVFLNFWATWCKPCIAEMESIEAQYQKHKNDVVFLAVSNEPLEKIKEFKKKNNFNFPIIKLNSDFLDVYVVSLPTTLLINDKMEIVHDVEGARDWNGYNNAVKINDILPKK